MNKKIETFSFKIIYIILGALALLLLFWNIKNFQNEKKQLKKSIANQLELTTNVISDSLMWNMISRLKSDSIQPLNKFEEEVVFEKKKKKHINGRMIVLTEDLNEDNEIRIKYQSKTDTGIGSRSESVITQIEIKAETNLLDDSFVWNDSLKQVWDTVLLQRLIKENLPIQFEIFPLSKTSVAGLSFPIKGHRISETASMVVFSNFHSYILKQIWLPMTLSFLLFVSLLSSILLLQRQWHQNEKWTKLKSEFIGNMTHELKTPIATASVAIEALSNFGVDDNPQKRREYLEISKNQINHLGLLVDKVLHVTSSSDFNKQLDLFEIDMVQIVQEVLYTLRPVIEDQRLNIQFMTTQEHHWIEGDQVHLANLVHNLIDNAIKYSSSNNEIKLSLDALEGYVHFKVEDNGIGIPREYVKQVTDRFFRVPTNNVHNIKGHGLGLYYVKNVVEAHNGRLNISSVESKGTTIEIIIPQIKLDND